MKRDRKRFSKVAHSTLSLTAIESLQRNRGEARLHPLSTYVEFLFSGCIPLTPL